MDNERDTILNVHRFSKEGGDYCIRCAHCLEVIGVEEGTTDGTPRGEQYRCRCGGWNYVEYGAKYVHEV